MPIIRTGFRETKAVRNSIEKAKKISLDKLKNDIRIAEIKEIEYKEDMGFVLVEYKYRVDYNLKEPEGKSLGYVDVTGEILYADKKEMIEELLKEWNDKRKIDREILSMFVGAAVNEAQIEAIVQAKKVNLPSPVPLPKLKAKTQKAA